MNTSQKIIDLTHTLTSEIPSWDGECCFRTTVALDYDACTPPNLFRVQRIEGKAGSGTHMDAPAHCIPGGKTIDAFDVADLTADCVVISCGEVNEEYVASPDVVERFEKDYGPIQPGSFVIFATGWDARWNEPEKYRNNLKFPSIHLDTAQLLLSRGICGLGIDTLSPDARGEDFLVHRAVLGAGKYIVENIANVKMLPPVGARILVMPLKIQEGTEAPARVVALLP